MDAHAAASSEDLGFLMQNLQMFEYHLQSSTQLQNYLKMVNTAIEIDALSDAPATWRIRMKKRFLHSQHSNSHNPRILIDTKPAAPALQTPWPGSIKYGQAYPLVYLHPVEMQISGVQQPSRKRRRC